MISVVSTCLLLKTVVCLSSLRDIDKVDELMQDITEQQELAQEISDAISKPVGFSEEFDEVRTRCMLSAVLKKCVRNDVLLC